MRSAIGNAVFFFVLLVSAAVSPAQDFFVFPSQGQSQQQMERDKGECQSWARQQTGFDPLATPRATAPPPARGAPQGGVVRGGVGGGMVGLAAGAIAGDAGRGAAIGAASGALLGGMMRSDQVRREQTAERQWAEQQAIQQIDARDRFNRAYKACLQGKGYTVN
ncbi:MAG: glycine zipper domain-containing protein [Desulfobacterales bacterium]